MALGKRLTLAAVAVAWLGTALLGACSSNDDAGSSANDAGTFQVSSYDADYDGCAAFSGNGTVCAAPSTQVCTPCDCVCAQGPDGLRWACIVDSAACAAPFSGGGEDGGEDGPVGTQDVNVPPVDSSKPDASSPVDANEPPDTSVPPDANDSAAPPPDDAGDDAG